MARFGGGWGEFPHVSNMQVTVDATRPPTDRVERVLIRGQILDPDVTYTLATTSYVADGGDGYTMLAEAERVFEDTSFSVFERVLANLQARVSVAPEIDNRLVIIQ